ncbi:MAG: SCO family protein [Bacteroidetes bacterium]|jgi:protein SCO1/2|nr:SCO family protein [Bacteroidota bacterium]
MKKSVFYLLFFTVLVLVFWVLLYFYTDYFQQSKLPQRAFVKPFSFINQNGQPFTNSDMEGKVCVVEYFFTTCESVCPIMNGNMQKVYDEFKNENDFLIVSHTCQPEVDSVPLLKAYAQKMGSDEKHWVFVTGKKDSLYSMARFSYGIDDPKNAVDNIEDDFIHSQFFALVDRNGSVRGGVYDGTVKEDVEKLKTDIKGLLHEKRKKGNFTGVYSN